MQDLDGRQQHLDAHLGGSPEVLVRNEFVDVHPLSTSMFQSQYYVYNIIYNVSGYIIYYIYNIIYDIIYVTNPQENNN